MAARRTACHMMCIVALLLRGDNTARRPAFDGDTYAGRNTGELHILGGGSKSQACCQSPPSPPHPIPTYSCCSDCAWHLARILCIRAHRKVLVSLGLHHLHAPQVLTRAPLGAAHSRQRRERHVICMTRRIRCGGAVALCRGTQARGKARKGRDVHCRRTPTCALAQHQATYVERSRTAWTATT